MPAGDDVTVTVGELGEIADGDEDVGDDPATALRRFDIEDDGPGIFEGHRNDVFERRFSIESDGTGVGLPIVAQIAEAHSLEVKVTNGADGGTRIAITGSSGFDSNSV